MAGGLVFSRVHRSSNNFGTSVAIQQDGKIIIAGYYFNFGNILFISRFNTDGKIDSTFGINGIAANPPQAEFIFEQALSVALDKDDNILTAGVHAFGQKKDFLMTRYSKDGFLDQTFGEGGSIITSAGYSNSQVNSLKIQSDGKLVIGGTAVSPYSSSYSVFTFARFVSETSVPVELNSFSAENSKQGVMLKWTTATELNSYGFEVQKKIISENNEWQKLVFINGKGNSNTTNQYSYIDKDTTSLDLYYRLKQIDLNGNYVYSNEIRVNKNLPSYFALEQNYPNPFNPSTKIRYSIPASLNPSQGGTLTQLKIYDILGKEVATLVNKNQQPGNYEVNFDASNLASGVYFYQLKAGNFEQVKKMVLLR